MHQLRTLNRLLGGSELGSVGDNESYDSRLNQLLHLLVDWRVCAENAVVGKLFTALQAVGLSDVVTTLQESLPVFVLKDTEESAE